MRTCQISKFLYIALYEHCFGMRETIVVQVGQCGNQIGNMFWSYMLQEHENTPDTDDALSAFFRFAPERSGVLAMKARALLIDMECGPLQETMRGPLGSLFDETQYVMDVYGSGNNWAHGFAEYGPKYRDSFEEGLRRNAEHCDSLQTFLITHSLGGGTGSGVGTFMLGLIDELYPEIYRFSTCVFPSEDDDVVTSPYNSILATRELIEHADCIFPLDNHALQNFAQLERQQRLKKEGGNNSSSNNTTTGQYNPTLPPAAGVSSKYKDRGFDDMNNVAARMLCHLTASSRFHGDMNVDMNEICTNLVPFPQLNFLMTSLSPQRANSGVGFGSGSAHVISAATSSAKQSSKSASAVSSSSSSSTTNKSKATSLKGKSSGAYRPNVVAVQQKSTRSVHHAPTFISRSHVQRAFSDILTSAGQLTCTVPTGYSSVTNSEPITLASAFITRSSVIALSDFLYCVTAAQSQQLKFPLWNANACKVTCLPYLRILAILLK